MRVLRAFREAALGLTLSFVNLVGAYLTLVVFGGLGSWSDAQFIGCFGMLELGTGVAFIYGPNIWRLPVLQAETVPPGGVRVSPALLRQPHWAAGVKAVAGGGLLLWAAWHEGASLASLALVPEVLLIALGSLALSLAIARLGALRPDIDVIQFAIRQPKRRERVLPAFSMSAAVLEACLNLGPFPFVKALPPGVLYRPAMAPSAGLLGWTLALAAVASAAAIAAWWGRIDVRAGEGTREPGPEDAQVRPGAGS